MLSSTLALTLALATTAWTLDAPAKIEGRGTSSAVNTASTSLPTITTKGNGMTS